MSLYSHLMSQALIALYDKDIRVSREFKDNFQSLLFQSLQENDNPIFSDDENDVIEMKRRIGEKNTALAQIHPLLSDEVISWILKQN